MITETSTRAVAATRTPKLCSSLADDIADRIAIARWDELDEIMKGVWGLRANSLLTDNEVEILEEAARTRRKVPQTRPPPAPSGAPRGVCRRPRRPARPREKCFGVGRPVPLDREAKNRLMVKAKAHMHPTEPGKHYGAITAKHFKVFERLVWQFHNARTGLCIPSYETMAEAAGCHRDTAIEALKAIEAARLITWCNRIKRVTIGGVRRVIRTSNSYRFNDPGSKSEIATGTTFQGISSLKRAAEIQPQGSQEGIRTRLVGANPSQDRKKGLDEEARDTS